MIKQFELTGVALAGILLSGLVAEAGVEWRNGDWQFSRNGKTWQTVSVPHDWAIAGPFDPEGDGATGKLPWRGVGHYRRGFALKGLAARRAAGERFYLEFDGVMARPTVRVNGIVAGGWDYGYMSFTLDVTEFLGEGANRVDVTADTTHHFSRWYPGAGIYREVRLVSRPREHVLPGTLAITTPRVTKDAATVHVAYVSSEKGEVAYDFEVRKPRLWDVGDPYLYELELCGERFRYGIRTFAFTADDGFHLNGRRVQLRGVNLHSDLGPLGMAFDRDVMKRQLLLMKDMGVNALRTSHNPPDPKVLDLCDELGFVVWDECFDKWEGTAGRLGDEDLDAYVTRNLRQFVRRDRNHPCVVLWSIGNEINGRRAGKNGMSRRRCAAFRAAIRELDVTRPVGNGNCFVDTVDEGCFADLDVTGWNYWAKYHRIKAKHPEKPIVYSESASALSSYGHYECPPSPAKTAYDVVAREVGGYDHNAGPDIPDVEFALMETDRYCAGEFVWTGIDYLGEPSPYVRGRSFPKVGRLPNRELARSSYFGIADLCGIPKDRYWLYRAYWNPTTPTLHILPHWNWAGREGGNVPVYVYTDGDEGELFVNGKSYGRRKKGVVQRKPESANAGGEEFRENPYYDVCDRYRLRWLDVAYEPGEVKVVAYRNGVKCGEAVMRTAGKPVAVRLADDPHNAPEAKTRFVQVDLVDAAGIRDPLARDRVSFRLSGPGEIVAVGNGNARGYDSFKAVSSHPLYYGKAVAVVRRTGAGRIVLTASVPGLKDGVLEIK